MENYIRSYSEMLDFSTYEDRVRYLQLNSNVGADTFGHLRYLNQRFYMSKEWRAFRRSIIIRDSGCDLAIPGLDLYHKIILHHINPITEYDIIEQTNRLMDPENLVCVSKYTHDLIHYGDSHNVRNPIIVRSPNDTCPWK